MSISEPTQVREREKQKESERQRERDIERGRQRRGRAELERLKCQFEVYYLLDTSTYWLHRQSQRGAERRSRARRRSVGRAKKRQRERERKGGRERAANCFSKYNKIRAEMGSCSRSWSRSWTRSRVEVGSTSASASELKSEQITWKWMQRSSSTRKLVSASLGLRLASCSSAFSVLIGLSPIN